MMHGRGKFTDEAAIIDAAPVLLEIAEASKALELELERAYFHGPLSERLRTALAKVAP